MTNQEHSSACFTAGHMQYLARIAYAAGVLTEQEVATILNCSQKVYGWLQSLPQHRGGKDEFTK